MAQEQEKALQSKYIEFQLVDQQIKKIRQQIQQFDGQLMELQNVVQMLEELKHVELGREILVPFSGGIFVRGELKDNKVLKVNVGANVVVEKSVEETKKLMEQQNKEINKYREELFEQLKKLIVVAQKLEHDLQKMMQQNE
ncbi:prefoldin subunit alpha [Candidatus Woesearchaeota archaeon]|nr:prefoldin subunit alpha [Candidatus Woesearchaeota archaeon]